MSLMFEQTIVRVRAPLVEDRYRNRKRDWDAASRTPVDGVNMQPAGVPVRSQEDTQDRQTTVTAWNLQTPEGVDLDLLETDRIEYDGMILEVDGKVGRWPDPFTGGVHHVEARLKEVD
ncbi:hypothetical protein KVH22_25440 [Streptomyces olivaceus]|uniref:hypothetical protein n=1 Tax=Streptomyces olivaceus TaxID=47716 RepID=UPI001CCE07AC|nr:hypothetical protein [Streptomyces olivaceus]MBZ6258863.1 hypothetical protein [Streptomyces olivaceus]